MSSDYVHITNLEKRLERLESWALVELPGALERVTDRIATLEAQTGSPGCRACLEGIHARIDALLQICSVEHDVFADKQPAQPRCCICGDSPETAFTEPLSCPDCGRHPQPAEVVDAISLLMRVVPILDLQVTEHNDARRLRSAICQYLADKGYPGWREARCPIEEAQRLTFALALQLGDLILSYTFTPTEADQIITMINNRVRPISKEIA